MQKYCWSGFIWMVTPSTNSKTKAATFLHNWLWEWKGLNRCIFCSGQTKNFNKYPASDVDAVGGMYDFDSIMHYGNYAFSKNRKATLVALKNPKLQFGSKLKLSKTDIMQLNAIYDCKSKCLFQLHWRTSLYLSYLWLQENSLHKSIEFSRCL